MWISISFRTRNIKVCNVILIHCYQINLNVLDDTHKFL